MQRARGHWLLALGELSPPNERPAVLLIGGLPGSGKSTLAKHLSEQYGFAVIRSDVVRKDIAGIPTLRRAAADFRTGLYSTEMTERTYAECRRRMERSLWEGRRVIVDASFLRESWRREFLDAAATWGVPGRFVHCVADPPTIRQRLQNRRNDVSDADWTIYQQAALQWELPAADTAGASFVFKSDADGEHEFYRLNKWMSDTLDIV
jgi:predicted kinase